MIKNLESESSMFIGTDEFVQLTTIPKSTLYSYVHYDQIPKSMYRKLGRRLVFIRSEVIKWIMDGAEIKKRSQMKTA